LPDGDGGHHGTAPAAAEIARWARSIDLMQISEQAVVVPELGASGAREITGYILKVAGGAPRLNNEYIEDASEWMRSPIVNR